MLRPVGGAVEKAGGLPQLDIRLDNRGLDRKPSIEEQPPHPPESHYKVPRPLESHDPAALIDESDDLLQLLCEDDDDEEEEQCGHGTSPPAKPQAKLVRGLSFNSKLEQLKLELLSQPNREGEEGSSKNGNGNKEEEPTYEDMTGSTSDSHPVYQNTPCPPHQDNDEAELSNAPNFDTSDQQENGSGTFDLKRNECYSSTTSQGGEAPPTQASEGGSGRGQEVYQDLGELDKYLRENKEEEEEGGHAPSNGHGHEYEDLDEMFVGKSDHEDHTYDVPDGGVLSQLAAPPPPQPEQVEMEEVLPFKNLPPLVCSAHLGDEVTLRKLADTAGSVLTQVVKHIHTSLGKYCSSVLTQVVIHTSLGKYCSSVLTQVVKHIHTSLGKYCSSVLTQVVIHTSLGKY